MHVGEHQFVAEWSSAHQKQHPLLHSSFGDGNGVVGSLRSNKPSADLPGSNASTRKGDVASRKNAAALQYRLPSAGLGSFQAASI
jgi:hypothetical protein